MSMAGFEDDGELSQETMDALKVFQDSSVDTSNDEDDAPAPATVDSGDSSSEPEAEASETPAQAAAPKEPEAQPQVDEAAASRAKQAFDLIKDFGAARTQHKEQHQDTKATPEPPNNAPESIKAEWQRNKLAAVRQQVATVIGTDDPAAVDGAMRAVFDDYTAQLLGVGVDSSSNPASSEAAQLRQQAAEAERRAAEAEAKTQLQQSEFEYERRVDSAKRGIASLLTSEKYPFLLAQDDAAPADMVWGIINQALQDGEDFTGMEEAALIDKYAKEAEQHFQTKAKRFAPLFTTKGDSATDTKQVTGSSKPTGESITNRDASTVPDKNEDFIEDDEESAAAAFKFYQQQQQKQADD